MFQGLDFWRVDPNGGAFSKAMALSADGKVVVGNASSSPDPIVFRWTRESGFLPLSQPNWQTILYLYGISANGSVVVGTGNHTYGQNLVRGEGFLWNGTTAGLGLLEGGHYSYGIGVSGDGKVAVGYGDSSNGIEALRWESGLLFPEPLGDLPAGSFLSLALGVSQDGNVIVGVGSGVAGGRAFRWTRQNGMQSLGLISDGIVQYSIATAASAYGSIVVGNSTSAAGGQAFRWKNDANGGQMVGLGNLPGGSGGIAYAVSADGSVIVGRYQTSTGDQAFIWNARWPQAERLQNLKTYLTTKHPSLTATLANWTLREARGISADGKTIVGNGTDPNRKNQAWIVQLPLEDGESYWGAKVRITLSDARNTFIEDWLIAVDDGDLILRGNVNIEANSQVSVLDESVRIPLSQVTKIALVEDTHAYNKYIVSPAVGGKYVVELRANAGDTERLCFSGNQWRLLSYSYDTAYRQHLTTATQSNSFSLIAIPRSKGIVDRAQARTALQTAATSITLPLTQLNKVRIIPLHIFYGIAWHESFNAGQGWNQFGYISQWDTTRNSNAGTVSDSADTKLTVVTIDGGVGIMQITGEVARQTLPANTGNRPPLDHLLTHVYKISSMSAYNIEAGAYLLGKIKWEDGWLSTTFAGNRNLYAASKSPKVLEHWREPVRLYNGQSVALSNNAVDGYPQKVWNVINHPPAEFNLPVTTLGGTLMSLPARDYPNYHVDLNGDGTIRVILSDFGFSRAANGNISLGIRAQPANAPTIPLPVLTATLATETRTWNNNQQRYDYTFGASSVTTTLIRDNAGIYRATITGQPANHLRFRLTLNLTFQQVNVQIIFPFEFIAAPVKTS